MSTHDKHETATRGEVAVMLIATLLIVIAGSITAMMGPAITYSKADPSPTRANTEGARGGEYAQRLLEAAGGDWEAIVWTSDPALNCGAGASEHGQGGCYRPSKPGVLFISPDMSATDTAYIVLHEYAHSIGYMDECEADKFALRAGGTTAASYYRVVGQCTGDDGIRIGIPELSN